jgi:hypothetical protein
MDIRESSPILFGFWVLALAFGFWLCIYVDGEPHGVRMECACAEFEVKYLSLLLNLISHPGNAWELQ